MTYIRLILYAKKNNAFSKILWKSRCHNSYLCYFFPCHLKRKNCSNGFIMNIIMKFFQATGANCICHNNTMSNVDKCTRRSFRDGTCHMKQCSKCTEYYLGFPEKGNILSFVFIKKFITFDLMF